MANSIAFVSEKPEVIALALVCYASELLGFTDQTVSDNLATISREGRIKVDKSEVSKCSRIFPQTQPIRS